mmetsp:Transcript_9357/g.20451  ORF Transcript_9357/g.20451 Transcript_9357/m.20451 type:complete len:233 (+) Transcript_9357:2209-2907(+)
MSSSLQRTLNKAAPATISAHKAYCGCTVIFSSKVPRTLSLPTFSANCLAISRPSRVPMSISRANFASAWVSLPWHSETCDSFVFLVLRAARNFSLMVSTFSLMSDTNFCFVLASFSRLTNSLSSASVDCDPDFCNSPISFCACFKLFSFRARFNLTSSISFCNALFRSDTEENLPDLSCRPSNWSFCSVRRAASRSTAIRSDAAFAAFFRAASNSCSAFASCFFNLACSSFC